MLNIRTKVTNQPVFSYTCELDNGTLASVLIYCANKRITALFDIDMYGSPFKFSITVCHNNYSSFREWFLYQYDNYGELAILEQSSIPKYELYGVEPAAALRRWFDLISYNRKEKIITKKDARLLYSKGCHYLRKWHNSPEELFDKLQLLVQDFYLEDILLDELDDLYTLFPVHKLQPKFMYFIEAIWNPLIDKFSAEYNCLRVSGGI